MQIITPKLKIQSAWFYANLLDSIEYFGYFFVFLGTFYVLMSSRKQPVSVNSKSWDTLIIVANPHCRHCHYCCRHHQNYDQHFINILISTFINFPMHTHWALLVIHSYLRFDNTTRRTGLATSPALTVV